MYSINASGAEQIPETNELNQESELAAAANHLAIYKRGRGFELGTTVKKSS